MTTGPLVCPIVTSHLGKKRILALVHQDPIKRNDISNYTDDANLFGWPKPVLGKWELRDVYIMNLRPVPSYSSYCYGSKVIYMKTLRDVCHDWRRTIRHRLEILEDFASGISSRL